MKLTIDRGRLISEIETLAGFSDAESPAVTRVVFTPADLKARAWLRARFTEAQLQIRQDAIGNIFARWVGSAAEQATVGSGSHVDAIPNAGKYDGVVGVLGGLEAIRALQRSGFRPRRSIELLMFTSEEPTRFGIGCLGSRMISGALSAEAAAALVDKDAEGLEQIREKAGFSGALRGVRLPENYYHAFVELHIEQGPVLEGLGLPLGVVLGTKGVERHAITFHGQEAHSGSTPMNVRRDALAAAAKLALEIRAIAGKHSDAVCTMGSVKTFPGIVTAVVGRCEATLDQRDLDARVLAAMYQEAREASERFAQEERCTVEWSRIWSIEPIAFHPSLISFCEAAVAETAGTVHRMPSGPLHDAAEVSRAGIPTVMMFVQSLRGISHNKIEDTREEHLELAVRAFANLAERTAHWIAG
jgi:N-carbamoyl-L-amino-acid hydrolase